MNRNGIATRANSRVEVPACPSKGRRLLKPRNISRRQLRDCGRKHRVHGGIGHRRRDADDDPAARRTRVEIGRDAARKRNLAARIDMDQWRGPTIVILAKYQYSPAGSAADALPTSQ